MSWIGLRNWAQAESFRPIPNATSKKEKLELSRSKLAQYQEQMAATKLYAPQDGLLVYAINQNRYSSESIIEEGATIRQRQAIVKIPRYLRDEGGN